MRTNERSEPGSWVLALAIALSLSAGCSKTAPSATSTVMPASSGKELAEGAPAPVFVATASDGTKVDLAALKGRFVVVYFYPRDDTPGCTKEACAFRDARPKYEAAKVTVIGVSVDDDESHRAFAKKHTLPFPLVSDASGAIAKSFGVVMSGSVTSRTTILIDPEGRVKRIFRSVDPAIHADEILALVTIK